MTAIATANNQRTRAELVEYAEEWLETCRGDEEETAKQLYRVLSRDLDEWLDAILTGYIPVLLNQCRHQANVTLLQAIERPAAPPPDRLLAAERAMAKESYEEILDWAMPGRKKLRDSTGAECIKFGERRLKQGLTNARRGWWLIKIGRLVGDEHRVGDVIDNEEAQRLFDATPAEITEPN